MKTIISAIALTFAVPAYAQTAPAADPHAGHAQHQGMDHGQHKQGEHDCRACCEKMKGKDGKMECMDKKDGGQAAAPAQSGDAHAGHAQ
jgi:hypothetical protein